MSSFLKGQNVILRDYPLGRPTNIRGKIVGVLSNDYYNILIQNGINEGQILTYKYWKLILDK